jgi:hypothetical protein
MNANDNLERGIADVYEREAPKRAPDWVLAKALETIESTPQRRVLIRAPWRFPPMNTVAKVAIAAVAVLVIGVVGLNMLSPRGSSNVGGSAPTASPSASPSPSPSPSASPSASGAASLPPPLTATFTSTMHGLSTKYPEGWKTAPATQPAPRPGLEFKSPDVDYIYDGQYTSDLFFAMASQPLGGKTPEAWISDFLNGFDGGCGAAREQVALGGVSGVICGADLFATTAGDRGYFVRLYTGSEIPSEWVDLYDETWFKTVLSTLELHPEAALDTAVASSASPSS